MDHPVYSFTLYQLLNLIVKLPDQEAADVYSVQGLPQSHYDIGDVTVNAPGVEFPNSGTATVRFYFVPCT